MKKVRIAIGAAALAPAAIALVPGTAHASTREEACTAAPGYWTKFHWIRSTSGGSTCFGYNGGTWYGAIGSASLECGGNNVGWYSGVNSGGEWNQTFVEGTTYRDLPGRSNTLSKVHISSWYGSDTCK